MPRSSSGLGYQAFILKTGVRFSYGVLHRCMNYIYKATVLKVIDGDTFDLLIDLGYHTFIQKRIRLDGVDTPEVRGEERPEGLISKAAVEELIGGQEVRVISVRERDKYGRNIARILFGENDVDLTDYLLDNKLGEPYVKLFSGFVTKIKGLLVKLGSH
jgi:micrococcal nuclease